jgi:quinol monooxygenase YgiN
VIHVIATIQLKEGTRDAFLSEFRQIIAPVRAEAGCLEYGPTVDVATGLSAQGPPREDVVTVVEKWDSLDALRAHLQAPHMLAYRPRVKDYVVSVQLQVLQPA